MIRSSFYEQNSHILGIDYAKTIEFKSQKNIQLESEDLIRNHEEQGKPFKSHKRIKKMSSRIIRSKKVLDEMIQEALKSPEGKIIYKEHVKKGKRHHSSKGEEIDMSDIIAMEFKRQKIDMMSKFSSSGSEKEEVKTPKPS